MRAFQLGNGGDHSLPSRIVIICECVYVSLPYKKRGFVPSYLTKVLSVVLHLKVSALVSNTWLKSTSATSAWSIIQYVLLMMVRYSKMPGH